MALWIAVLLGTVQGVFMFVPVSSTAHLVLVQHWLIRAGEDLPPPESPEMILFDLMVHVGTMVSVLIVFRHSLWKFTTGIFADIRPLVMRADTGELLFVRLALLGALSVLVTGILGLTFKAAFEQVFASPPMIAITLALTGVLLWWTDVLPRRTRGLRRITPVTAIIIGAAQALSLIPGLSRSGMTIVFALFTGLKRRWAAQYSFFLAIPTILAATALQGLEVIRANGINSLDWPAMAVGFVTAAAVGTVALRLVLFLLYRARLRVFSFYLWFLATAILFGFVDFTSGM